MKVLFVCLGNICRSPAAEGVFQTLVDRAGFSKKIQVDSAGTSAFHEGSPADGRMRSAAAERGIELTSISRQFVKRDFSEFDLILTMDNSNYKNVLAMADTQEQKSKIKKMTDYCKIHSISEVPDPYTGGVDGFRYVMDILEDSCGELFNEVKALVEGKK